jgi:hypothetical protein
MDIALEVGTAITIIDHARQAATRATIEYEGKVNPSIQGAISLNVGLATLVTKLFELPVEMLPAVLDELQDQLAPIRVTR